MYYNAVKAKKGEIIMCRKYLFITFAIMLLCWGSCVVCGLFGLSLTQMPLLYVPYVLGGLSPTIASFLVKRKDGFKAWLKATFDFKHGLLSYLLVLVLAACFFLVLCLFSGFTPGAPLFFVPFMLPVMLFGGGLEEPGWRSILLPELEKKVGFFLSTLITALVWWLWHLPLFFIPGVGQYGADFFAYGLNVLGLGFALAAVKKCTGSTWLCILLHCLVNSLHSVFIIHETYLGSAAAAAVMILLSLVLMQVQKRKNVFT